MNEEMIRVDGMAKTQQDACSEDPLAQLVGFKCLFFDPVASAVMWIRDGAQLDDSTNPQRGRASYQLHVYQRPVFKGLWVILSMLLTLAKTTSSVELPAEPTIWMRTWLPCCEPRQQVDQVGTDRELDSRDARAAGLTHRARVAQVDPAGRRIGSLT
uniref:Uncharacterized protein n=1 Tax=Peronospora matthiolae TaxID=2874970 RepID=A0AAV1V2Y4_9STRA